MNKNMMCLTKLRNTSNHGNKGDRTAGCDDVKGVDVWSTAFGVADRPPEESLAVLGPELRGNLS